MYVCDQERILFDWISVFLWMINFSGTCRVCISVPKRKDIYVVLTGAVWFIFLYFFWKIGDPFPILSPKHGQFYLVIKRGYCRLLAECASQRIFSTQQHICRVCFMLSPVCPSVGPIPWWPQTMTATTVTATTMMATNHDGHNCDGHNHDGDKPWWPQPWWPQTMMATTVTATTMMATNHDGHNHDGHKPRRLQGIPWRPQQWKCEKLTAYY